MTHTLRGPRAKVVVHTAARNDPDGWMGNITVMTIESSKSAISRESYSVGPPRSTKAEALTYAEIAVVVFLGEFRGKGVHQI